LIDGHWILPSHWTFQMQRFSITWHYKKHFIFPYFFKPQCLKYNVWNATFF
jgi:hypothetical protein